MGWGGDGTLYRRDTVMIPRGMLPRGARRERHQAPSYEFDHGRMWRRGANITFILMLMMLML